MPRRRADKIDANQPDIVSGLEKLGYSVEVGHDDIIVAANGQNYWFEIKSEECRSKITNEILQAHKKPSQIRLENEWPGHYRIVTCIEEILDDINTNR